MCIPGPRIAYCPGYSFFLFFSCYLGDSIWLSLGILPKYLATISSLGTFGAGDAVCRNKQMGMSLFTERAVDVFE